MPDKVFVITGKNPKGKDIRHVATAAGGTMDAEALARHLHAHGQYVGFTDIEIEDVTGQPGVVPPSNPGAAVRESPKVPDMRIKGSDTVVRGLPPGVNMTDTGAPSVRPGGPPPGVSTAGGSPVASEAPRAGGVSTAGR